jgi:ParB family chromosome partitioning protein
MGKVKYKKPSNIMNRMIVKTDKESRLSLGMTEIKGEIYYLNPSVIVPYKNQARKNIKEESLIELASSIKSQGIIQPLQVIPSLENHGKFEVVSGERRLRAALKIGLNTVPCIVLDRERDANEIALIENIQRENLHPIELANAIANLIKEKPHGSQSLIAERIGVSKQQISHLMAIARMPEDVKNHLLHRKDLNITFIKAIAYLNNENDMRERVFKTSMQRTNFRSILRISSDGISFRYDQIKIDSLSKSEKKLLKFELSTLINKLEI